LHNAPPLPPSHHRHSPPGTLVNLHAGKNAANEDVGGIKANGAGEAKEGVGDDEHVAEVHDHGDPLCDVQLGVEVEQGVQEQVCRRGAGREVRSPPATNSFLRMRKQAKIQRISV